MAWTERYVRADAAGGGDGTTDTNSGGSGAFTLAEAITHSASNTGIRYNVKAGTYANTTTNRTFNGVGLTTAPNWWRGFNASIGDLDSDPVTAKPAITFTTGAMTVSGAHQIFSNLSISGAPTGNLLTSSAAGVRFQRVRVENTGTNAGSRAVNVSTAGSVWVACWFKATSSASSVGTATVNVHFTGCTFTGGGHGLTVSSTGHIILTKCTFRSCGADGLNSANTNTLIVQSCTFAHNTGDGIEIGTLPSYGSITDCLFVSNGGYGINQSTGTNTNLIHRAFNDFYNNTSGTETGFGDSPSLNEQTEGSSPITSSTDLSIVTGANAKANGLPGLFENEAYSSYADIGAVQRQEPAGGSGGLLVNSGMTGGMRG